MDFKVGDIVTRNSYNNDMSFMIIDISEEICYLKGVNIRLYADSPISDLQRCIDKEDTDDEESTYLDRIKVKFDLDRNDYFYLPGKILHIDAESPLCSLK